MHHRFLLLRAATAAAIVAITAFIGTAQAAPLVGPTSRLYLDSYSDKSLYVVQGANVLASSLAYCNHCEAAIAVNGDIRSQNGGQYKTSDLSQTGVTYGSGPNYFGDGTTDGVRNYAVGAYGDNRVYAYDRDWGQQSVLFSVFGNLQVAGTELGGITFDPTNQSLWLQGSDDNDATTFIRNYSLNGTLLRSFTSLGGRALAMDYADGTLWSVRGPTRFFDQYDRLGNFLQTAMYDPVLGFQGGTTGAEFDLAGDVSAVPEPGSLALMLAGLMTMTFVRQRRAR